MTQGAFEDYTASKLTTGTGVLFPIRSTHMQLVPGSAGASGAYEALSDVINIGFSFRFNDKTYSRAVVCSSGWMVLLQDGQSTFSYTDVLETGAALSRNDRIKQQFSNGVVLLAPWFANIRSTFKNALDAKLAFDAYGSPPVSITNDQINAIAYGYSKQLFFCNETEYGVRYANKTDKTGRSCFVVRWSSISYAAALSDFSMAFDAVVYEDGAIAYMYGSRDIGQSYATLPIDDATVGVFTNDSSLNGWRFRDYAALLSTSTRTSHKFGAAAYDASFTDTSSSSVTVPYAVSLRRMLHYPGLGSGSTIVLSAPMSRRKTLPRKLIRERDAVSSIRVVARTGDQDRMPSGVSYDDRKTLNYVSGTIVDYPTSLQRSYYASDSSMLKRLDLFGSLELTASINKSVAEENLHDRQTRYIEPFKEADNVSAKSAVVVVAAQAQEIVEPQPEPEPGPPGGYGEVIYSPPISYLGDANVDYPYATWTCPANVTSVNVVVIGRGGRGGLAKWREYQFDTNWTYQMESEFVAYNPSYASAGCGGGAGPITFSYNVPVVPGNTYPIRVIIRSIDPETGKPNYWTHGNIEVFGIRSGWGQDAITTEWTAGIVNRRLNLITRGSSANKTGIGGKPYKDSETYAYTDEEVGKVPYALTIPTDAVPLQLWIPERNPYYEYLLDHNSSGTAFKPALEGGAGGYHHGYGVPGAGGKVKFTNYDGLNTNYTWPYIPMLSPEALPWSDLMATLTSNPTHELRTALSTYGGQGHGLGPPSYNGGNGTGYGTGGGGAGGNAIIAARVMSPWTPNEMLPSQTYDSFNGSTTYAHAGGVYQIASGGDPAPGVVIIWWGIDAEGNGSSTDARANPPYYYANISEDPGVVQPVVQSTTFSGLPNASVDFGGNPYVSQLGDALTQPYSTKTKITVEIPIEHSTKMLEARSSVLYCDALNKKWHIPHQATGDIANPLELFNGNFQFPEDGRLFGALGNTLSSGSNVGPSAPNQKFQSDVDYIGLNAKSSTKNISINSYYSDILTHRFEKSVQNNPDYEPNKNDQFSLPICSPFLLERADISIPFMLGDGWFRDRTTMGTVPYGVYDIAGPAMTLSLLNQVKSGPFTRRDVILSGTIISAGDSVPNVKAYKSDVYGTTPSLWVFSSEGFTKHNVTPACVVSPATDDFGKMSYTGSVFLSCIAATSNGATMLVYYMASPNSTSSPAPSAEQVAMNKQHAIRALTSKTLDVNTNLLINVNDYSLGNAALVRDIDTFGRSASSFEQSGRSVLGKEYITTQNNVSSDGMMLNTLYCAPSYDELPANIKGTIDSTEFTYFATTAVNVATSVPSPYLVMPGDKLTLALSKMRPVIDSDGTSRDYFTGSLRHDVVLAPGTVKLTLYGSQLRNGVEFHDTLNQQLSSDVVHEVICNDPVLDQFEVEYSDTHYGSYTDDYITGSLATTNFYLFNKKLTTTSYRGKVFSKLQSAAAAAQLSSIPGSYDALNYPSLSYRLQPWSERVGTQRVTQAACNNERYYDSMMPSLEACFRADGAKMFVRTYSTWKENGVTISLNDNSLSGDIGVDNKSWVASFPFEQRYSNVMRQLKISAAFTTTTYYDIENTTMYVSSPITLDSVYVTTAVKNAYSVPYETKFVDKNVQSDSVVGMSSTDASKVLFGFGDFSTLFSAYHYSNEYFSGNVSSGGVNRFSSYRTIIDVENYITLVAGPVIRGWKYGVYSGLPMYTRAYYRRGRYGHFRDMLEQRQYTKFFNEFQQGDIDRSSQSVLVGAVTVKFIDANGNTTKPESTMSQNTSYEAVSVCPYFDGQAKDRPSIQQKTLNTNTLMVSSDAFGQVTI